MTQPNGRPSTLGRIRCSVSCVVATPPDVDEAVVRPFWLTTNVTAAGDPGRDPKVSVSGSTCQFVVVQGGCAPLTARAGTTAVEGRTNQNERLVGQVDDTVTTTLVRQVVASVCTRTGLVVAKARVAAVVEADFAVAVGVP